jgi:glycosyltransferase involved in cell wall biosynthesis
VIEHERSGLIISPFHPSEYVVAGNRLNGCAELRKAFGAEARQRIEAAFTEDRERDAWLTLYRRLGSKKRK